MELSLSVIILLSLALSVSAQHYTVYSPPYGNVLVLNATTIYSDVFDSDKAWLIQFHDHGCQDDCKDYSPLYEKFAADVNDWRNVVVIAAFNCGLQENKATCKEFLISGPATLRFFPPHSPKYVPRYPIMGTRPSYCDSSYPYYQSCSILNPLCRLAQRLRTEGTCLPRPRYILNPGLERNKRDAIFNLKMDLINTLEVHFPKLLKFSNNFGSDMQQLLNCTDELYHHVRPTGVVVIFEGANSYLGKEVTLKLSLFKFIKVYHFLKSNNIYLALNLDTWPAAGFIGENGLAQRIQIGQRDWVNKISKAVLECAGVLVTSERTSTIPLPAATATTLWNTERESSNENKDAQQRPETKFARTSSGSFRYPVTPPRFTLRPIRPIDASQIPRNAEILKNIG